MSRSAQTLTMLMGSCPARAQPHDEVALSVEPALEQEPGNCDDLSHLKQHRLLKLGYSIPRNCMCKIAAGLCESASIC